MNSNSTLLFACFFLLGTMCYGQNNFKNDHLKLQSEIAASPFKSVQVFMKKKNFISDGKEKMGDGSYLYTYNNGFITLSYSKQKDLVFIIGDIMTTEIILLKKELKEKKFIQLSETPAEEFGPKTVGSKWGKAGYPYRFVIYHTNDKVSLFSLQTNKYEMF